MHVNINNYSCINLLNNNDVLPLLLLMTNSFILANHIHYILQRNVNKEMKNNNYRN